jgi:hypothetical protein
VRACERGGREPVKFSNVGGGGGGKFLTSLATRNFTTTETVMITVRENLGLR